jgi:hypothetical protein
MGVIYILSLTAMILHMMSHLIPIIVTNPSLHEKIEPCLHHPAVFIAAWSFLPLAVYHLWKDRKLHERVHALEDQLAHYTKGN